MTDEELADKSFFNHDLTYAVTRDERSYKEGFIEGLKAGRIEWHDLRKDPNDLPISMEPASALGSRTVLDQNGEPCWYSYKYKQWKNDKKRTDGTYDCKVIAWCDIPKFKEEQDA